MDNMSIYRDLGDLWEAVDAFQQEGLKIVKDTEVSFGTTNYSHAKLDDIIEDIAPLLVKHDLFLTHWPSSIDGEPALTMLLRHKKSGQELATTMALPLSKKDPQALGSAITYMRRYSIGAVLRLHLVDDDDAHSATHDKPKDAVKGALNDKAVNILVGDINEAGLSDEGKAELRRWMRNKGFTLVAPTTIREEDLDEIYRKISSLKDPIVGESDEN